MYLGIDIGTGSVKAAMLMADGSVEEATEGYAPQLRPGVQSTPDLERACSLLLKKAWALARERRDPVLGLSASGHGPSIVVVDGHGMASAELVTWQDSSNTSEAAELATLLPSFSKTGECWEAKVLSAWRSRGGEWRGETALYPKDYLLFLLCGARVMDRPAASTLGFFDRAGGAWKEGRAFGLDTRFLPEVAQSWERVGSTGTAFSRACGIPDGIPIYAGGIDAWCEAIGAGAVEPGDLVDGSGTSTCVSACLADASSSLEHSVPGRGYRIETVSYTGGSAQWAEELLGYPIARWKEERPEVKPLPILFLPYLIGERSPIWNEEASGLFLGLRREDGPAELMGAVFQGTAFAVAQCLALVDPGRAARAVRAVGGGAGNLAWARMKASASGRSYWIMKARNAAPLGAAMLAAHGAGAGTLSELAKLYVGVESVVEPEEGHSASYARLLGAYGRAYRELESEMRLLAEERRS